MSAWWLAPLGVGAAGAVALSLLRGRLEREADRLADTSARLRRLPGRSGPQPPEQHAK
ncbi:hypothetical protein K6U06_09895 [Acidiferrimicrobium sp. IK]|nr:hypothetical protein [Acidiferrimicrobium sp. IK]